MFPFWDTAAAPLAENPTPIRERIAEIERVSKWRR
jgi:hypothetical protein